MLLTAYEHVAGVINEVYKDLTRSEKHRLGGTAMLELENPMEPFSGTHTTTSACAHPCCVDG